MSKYKFTNPKMHGYIIGEYIDGNLFSLEFHLTKPLSVDQWLNLTQHIRTREDMMHTMYIIHAQLIEEVPSNVKIATFCRMYEQATGVKYKVSAADSGKVKKIDINEDLLKCYFNSDNFLFKGRYSIGNLVKYYNELLVEQQAPAKSKYPIRYDRDYERKLSPQQLSEYWKHLRSLGFTPTKNQQGQIVDWK